MSDWHLASILAVVVTAAAAVSHELGLLADALERVAAR